MNNKDPNKGKKKGFYAALYACIGVVMVSAAVVSFNNLTAKPTDENPVDFSQMEATSQNDSESYLTPAGETAETASQVKKPKTTPSPAPSASLSPSPAVPTSTPAPAQQSDATTDEEAATITEEEPVVDVASEQAPAAEVDASDGNTQDGGTAVGELRTDIIITKPLNPALAEGSLPEFTEESKMAWPVTGEVVMDYSSDHAIYDVTLDQYRTNDNICIAADVGTEVVASADGVVSSVDKTKENGNTVVIDHGNGWSTTYCQLQDGVLVAQGDVVTEGQSIGNVGSPSIYSVLLGNHVGFQVAKDDTTIDPKVVLE